MALTVETGTGIVGASAYVSRAAAITYWTDRPHDALGVAWLAESTANQDGSIIEATAYLDGTLGAFYRGHRRGEVQGLLFPRTGAKDDAGYPLPDLPSALVNAVCELSGRAISARLSADLAIGGRIKSTDKQLGPLKTRIEYFDTETAGKTYGFVTGLLAPILNGSQPSAAPSWNWT